MNESARMSPYSPHIRTVLELVGLAAIAVLPILIRTLYVQRRMLEQLMAHEIERHNG